MYTLIGKLASRAFRVGWMLEELGVEWEQVPASQHTDEVYRLNPAGKIPALVVDGDAVLVDSTAIMTYLADKHGKLTFAAGTLERARQDGFTQTIIDEFDQVLYTSARTGALIPEELRSPQVKDGLHWEYRRNLARFAETFEGPFLMGEQMTLADILLTHCLQWGAIAKFPFESDKMRAYVKDMTSRDAYRSAHAKMS